VVPVNEGGLFGWLAFWGRASSLDEAISAVTQLALNRRSEAIGLRPICFETDLKLWFFDVKVSVSPYQAWRPEPQLSFGASRLRRSMYESGVE
jgi:hypothetical protein